MSDKIKGFAVKEFNDAGAERTFEGGKVHEFETGAYANYAAAGLVREPTADELRAATKADAPKADAPKS